LHQRARRGVAGAQQDREVAEPPAESRAPATATAVVAPSGIDVRTAAAISAPSTNVWNASPMITSDAALLVCTSQSVAGVAVPPQDQLLEEKERETRRAACRSACVGGMRDQRFRQQREQRHAEQRADRIADQPRMSRSLRLSPEEKKRRRGREPADASQYAEPNRRRVDLHAA
jgi:hypothetical protein